MMRVLLVMLPVVLCGCPRDVPVFSPDGKQVALLLDVEEREQSEAERQQSSLSSRKAADTDKAKQKGAERRTAIGIVSVATKEFKRYELPDGWCADGVVWVLDHLLVEVSRPKSEWNPGEAKREMAYLLFDPQVEKFTFTEIPLHMSLSPFLVNVGGKESLLAPELKEKADGEAEEGTVVFSLPEFNRRDALDFGARGIGDGWMIRIKSKKRDLISDIQAIEVRDSQGKRAATISRDEIAKACYRDARFPTCAVISDDHASLLLGFDTSTVFRRHPAEYTFGIYDIKTGKLAWEGSSNALRGTPVFREGAVYVLEPPEKKIYTGDTTYASMLASTPASQPTAEVVLARFTEKGREVLFDVPIPELHRAARYSPSLDRKSFALLVEGPSPEVLVIPIKAGVGKEDLVRVPVARR